MIRTETASGKPIPRMFVEMRYEGRVVPEDVMHALASLQGARVVSDARGQIVLGPMPAGSYEFRARTSGSAPPSVRMQVTVGETVAVMTFAESNTPR